MLTLFINDYIIIIIFKMNLAFNFITTIFKDSKGKSLSLYLRYIDYICFIVGIAAPILMVTEITLEDQKMGL